MFSLLCLHCWLHPVECLALTWSDLSLDPLLEVCGAVQIRNPKIKTPSVQHVIIECPGVASICRVIKTAFCRSERRRIFPYTTFALHRKWAFCMCALHFFSLLKDPKLETSRPTVGGLRSSGATIDFMHHENLDRLKWRGRWSSDAVLKHYLQFGVYHLAALTFSATSRELIVRYDAVFARFKESIVE